MQRIYSNPKFLKDLVTINKTKPKFYKMTFKGSGELKKPCSQTKIICEKGNLFLLSTFCC